VTAIRCFVGQVRAPRTVVPLPLRLAGREPGDFITAAAANIGTPLTVTMDYSRLQAAGEAPVADSYHLHRALRELTSNAPVHGCTTRIGLVLADRYADDGGVLGYMFDTGFDPHANDGFNAMPREGCAIFLDAIRDIRASLTDYETEAGFTAVHELGHVFNLWHVETLSFLKQSQSSAPFGRGAFHFTSEHEEYLSHIDSRFVCPGGSRWDDRGDLALGPGQPLNGRASQRIRLHVALPQDEFWCFEPVQLDVTVSTAPRVQRTKIPDAVDPGYDAFNLWIEAPDGTRRKYRSPVLYCDRRPQRTIARGAPFRRDIPLFGQSAGYTFRVAGRHRIFCTFRLRDGSIATSNAVEAFVKPAAARRMRFTRLRDTLTDRDNAQTLFYRAAARPSKVAESLEAAARDLRRTPSAANIRYSVARALATASRSRGRDTRILYRTRAARLLKVALDSGALSLSRQRRATQTLETLEQG
jgi:hypothetical protein